MVAELWDSATGCANNAQARAAPAHEVGVYKEKSERSSRTFDQSSSEENESAFDAQNLTELVNHAHQIVLVFHHGVDALVGCRNFIKHSNVLAAHDAFGLHLEIFNREASLEAFFTISPDKNCPFIIHSANNNYTVLGTSFNLQSYARENFAVVTLHTGCLQAQARKDVIILDPPRHGDRLLDRSLGPVVHPRAVRLEEVARVRTFRLKRCACDSISCALAA